MQFKSTDPDVETLVRRIERDLIDLQPDFQRGDVWSRGKQQRLIDTVLRGWHIPPIHLVDRGNGRFDVLDGQQRLMAIREFVRGTFAVDGMVEPVSEAIKVLGGKRWMELPEAIQEQFHNFTIRVFQLSDFEPSEPYELFFRLNQPTNLTEAEKRNAFIGIPRNQVKALAELGKNLGMEQSTVGFSNSRMAYDETLARFLIFLESASLSQKLTSTRITERYRSGEPFSNEVMTLSEMSLTALLQAIQRSQVSHNVKPNKATLHTWLCLSASIVRDSRPEDVLTLLISGIEGARSSEEKSLGNGFSPEADRLFNIFDDRSTSRVLDVSSVILRDFCTWAIAFLMLGKEALPSGLADMVPAVLEGVDLGRGDADTRLYERLTSFNWGDRRWI